MYEIFAQLLEINNLKAADVCKGTGLPSSLFSEWKRGKSTPKADKMKKIADFFGVSVDYLMTGKAKDNSGYYLNEETAQTAQEMYEKDKILFDVYRSTDRKRLVEYAKRLKQLRDMEEGEM